ADVQQPIAPDSPAEVAAAASRAPAPADRERLFGGRLPEREGGLTLAQAVNRTLLDAALQHPGLLVFGEDVARKGGGYGVTPGRTTPLPCSAPAWRQPLWTVGCACSWSRSRSTTPATCTPTATAAGWPATRRRRRGRPGMCRSAAAAPTATAPT